MKTSKFISILLISSMFFFSGCTAYRNIANLDQQQKEIAALSVQINKIDENTKAMLQEQQAKIESSVKERISVGGAQAISVLGTLQANPTKDKYTDAGIKGLKVTKEALIDQVDTKDLIDALEIQTQLLSEKAEEVAKANERLGILSTEIDERKQNEIKLAEEREKLKKQSEEQKASLIAQREALEKEYEEYKKAKALKDEEDAQKWREENKWYHKINPFRDLFSGAKKIFGWVIFFVIFGFIMKILKVVFPHSNIIGTIVGSVGRLFGATFKVLFGWIPDTLRGMQAVDYKEYKKEKALATNSMGAIQEFKDSNPEEYKKLLKDKLRDWHEDDPELDKLVEQRLYELNLKSRKSEPTK